MARHFKTESQPIFTVKNAVKFSSLDIDFYTNNNCITQNTCNHFIKSIDKYAIPSGSKSNRFNTNIAKSNYMICDLNEARVTGYDRLICYIADLFSVNKNRLESLQGLKFDKEGYHGRHVDFIEGHITAGAASIEKYGQRIITFVVYLNDVEDGGETLFPMVSIRVKPAVGKMIAWGNIDRNCRLNYFVMREEQFVRAKTKYMLLGHVRERKIT